MVDLPRRIVLLTRLARLSWIAARARFVASLLALEVVARLPATAFDDIVAFRGAYAPREKKTRNESEKSKRDEYATDTA
jgi:hypothetical protein